MALQTEWLVNAKWEWSDTRTYTILITVWNVNFSQRWRFLLGLPDPVDGGIRLPPTPGQLITSQVLIIRPNTTCRPSIIIFYYTLQPPVDIALQSSAPYKNILNFSLGINRKNQWHRLSAIITRHNCQRNRLNSLFSGYFVLGGSPIQILIRKPGVGSPWFSLVLVFSL